mgnify:FL=1
MKIDTISNFGSKVMYNDFYFKRISFTDNKVIKLLDEAKGQYEKEIINLLNTINDQNIEAICFEKHQYKHRGKWLGYTKFSKAESVFLLAGIADLAKKEIWLHTDITQLTRSTLRKFIKKFYNSPYVNIIYDSESSRAFFNAMIKEALQ